MGKKDLLIKALLMIETEDQCEALLNDLLTSKEIDDLTNRLVIAQMLDQGMTFVDIEGQVRASSATISRVNRCLKTGTGYRFVVDHLQSEETE